MSNDLLDFFSSLSEVLTGVEVTGIFGKMTANSRGHGKTKVGVDVDFANGHGRSLAKHFLGNTDGVGHLSAEFVDDCDVLLRNRGSAVKNNGESGKKLGNLFKNVETELGFLTGFEFICAVACADGNGKGINAGAAYEILNLFGLCVGRVLCGNADLDPQRRQAGRVRPRR